MSAPRSAETEFKQSWDKAQAWAESQGIDAAAYMPVYQLDLARVQQGDYPMSAGERNREILAANTPNNVTPSTRTSPSPSNVLHNAMNTARNLFTGLIHLPEEFWHMADNTLHAVEDPASQEGKTPWATLGNWMNNTLLSLIPGVSDVGTLFQKGLGAGLSTLAEHPVLSTLDLLPGEDGGILKRLSREGTVSEDAVRSSLAGKLASKLGSIPTKKAGVPLSGGAGVMNLTVSQRLQRLAGRVGPGGAGVGAELSNLGAFVNQTAILSQNLYSWLMDGPQRIVSQLNPDELGQVRDLFDTRQADGGDKLHDALDSPDTPPMVKEAVLSLLDGPERFAVEESIFAGDLRAVETLEGKTRYYAKPRIKAIETAGKVADKARTEAMKGLDTLSEHADNVAKLDAMLPPATQRFLQGVTEARQGVANDPKLLENVTQELADPTKFRAKRGLPKGAQVAAVIGEGGLADDFVKQIRKDHNPAQVKSLAEAMKDRLSKWGPRSVNAAEVPALANLYQLADAFSKWADEYLKEKREIDEAIHGELDAQRHFQGERGRYGQARVRTLRDRQALERQNLTDRTAQLRRTARERFAGRQRDLQATSAGLIAGMVEDAEARAENLTGQAVDRDIMPKLTLDIARTRNMLKAALTNERRDYLAKDAVQRAERQRDAARMVRRHEQERAALTKDIAGEKAGMGEVVTQLEGWAKAVDGYHKAIFDHPADQFRDAMLVLFQKHLLAHENTAHLVEQTERHVERTAGRGQVEVLRNDPKILSEYMVFAFNDIFGDPRLDPDVARDAGRYMREAWKSADGELKTLIAQGFEVPYIPASTSADALLGRDAIKPFIGKGIPKGDIAKGRVWDFTPQTGDFAVGINKAVVQALQRSATVEMVEHYIKPKAMTGEEMRAFVTKVKGVAGGAGAGNLSLRYADVSLRYADVARHEMAMETVDIESMFGFAMPRWAKGELWLPKPLVKAMQQIADERRSPLAKVTKVFRYSILGLSPRYDAHVLFGGATMAALRSSPKAITLIGDAWRAVRDGTLPEIPGHAAIEEGFDTTVLNLWHQQAGREMGALAIGEHVEKVQGIKLAASKPVHWLKATADLNFKFTRYVRDVQAAVVYMDGAAKYERQMGRLRIEDPETGRLVEMSPERAMEAGMRHVEQVFGNLGKMSPLERKITQSIMPFYSWQKHMLAYVMRFPFDHPWRALVLSQLADRASEDIPASWPVRIELLFFLGSPGATGATSAVDLRSLDPFRTTANYFSLTGWMESLNPVLLAPAAMIDPNIVYGQNVLYPGLTYTAFYGTEGAGAQGNLVTGLSQIAPQLSAFTSALSGINNVRSLWTTDRSAAIKQLLDNLNIPFVTPPVNLKQVAAHGEQVRYEVAKTLAYSAFQSGTFKAIQSYRSVPNPVQPDYTITPQQLEALYAVSKAQQPTVPPIEAIVPPPAPYGF